MLLVCKAQLLLENTLLWCSECGPSMWVLEVDYLFHTFSLTDVETLGRFFAFT